MADNVDFYEPSHQLTSGASGAELANIVNEAALRAVRDGRRFCQPQADLEESVEVVIAGYQNKSRVLSEKEKLIVSYHEVGHALVAALQTNSAPVHKITIIPRTSAARLVIPCRSRPRRTCPDDQRGNGRTRLQR